MTANDLLATIRRREQSKAGLRGCVSLFPTLALSRSGTTGFTFVISTQRV